MQSQPVERIPEEPEPPKDDTEVTSPMRTIPWCGECGFFLDDCQCERSGNDL